MSLPSAIAIVALASLLALGGHWVYVRVRRARYARFYSDYPELHWVQAEESPLRRRVLDCRGYCKLMPDPVDPRLLKRHQKLTHAGTSDLAERLPEGSPAEGLAVSWPFAPGEMVRLRAGYKASALEDRWIIRHERGRLGFQRSWTGALVYVAELCDDGDDGGRITRLWLRASDSETPEQSALHVALVRYLIDSHLLQRTAAVPVPAELAGDPMKMALFAFRIGGRHAEYAEPFWPNAA